jgi:hypothetical protein
MRYKQTTNERITNFELSSGGQFIPPAVMGNSKTTPKNGPTNPKLLFIDYF